VSGEPETHKLDTHELMKFIDRLTQETAEEQRAQLAVVAGQFAGSHGGPLLLEARVDPRSGARAAAFEHVERDRLANVTGHGEVLPHASTERGCSSTRKERMSARGQEQGRSGNLTSARVHVLFPPLRGPRASERAARAALTMLGRRAEVERGRAPALPVRSFAPRLFAIAAVALLTCALLHTLCAERADERSLQASGPPPLPTVDREPAIGPFARAFDEPTTSAAPSSPQPLRARSTHVASPRPQRVRARVLDATPHDRTGVANESEQVMTTDRRHGHSAHASRAAVAASASTAPLRSAPSSRVHSAVPAEPSPQPARASRVRDVAPALHADSPSHPLRREVVDLLLEGRTRAALDGYRALLFAGEQPALLGEVVRMLEQELRACEQEGAAACGR
jgi:hypothetical protein